MTNTVHETVQRVDKKRVDLYKRSVNWKLTISSVIVIIALAFGAISYYQSTRFNVHISINGTNVGGLTTDQAIKKLESSVLKNEVYIGQERIFHGNDTKSGFTDQDLPNVKKLLKRQWTLLPSSKVVNYSLMPIKGDQFRSQTMKKLLEEKLISVNKGLKAPQNSQAYLRQGNIIISKSINGKQYDVASILKDYEKQEYNSEIYLNPAYIQPIKADSPIINKEEQTLKGFLQRTVDYTVQNKVFSLKASDLIKNAYLSKDRQVIFDPTDIKKKIAEIDHSQSTLNKNFLFKTHSGSVISVKGESYGWALDVGKETNRIQEAFRKGEKSIVASNIYGKGWSTYGTGFESSTNNGIGNTYAEVSIKDQRIWLYRNGRLVVTTHVVTGRHDVGEDTHPGVWYIMYKQSPSVLVGSEVGMANYRVPVAYWAPFTNDGEGFHDAGWRKNWSSTAYLHQGSGGCVNTPPSVMKSVYDNLSQYEPVVIY